ncbi:MAG TPA: TIGR03619 family F420-dependent LLM class oxidoreductase [Microthrixaceae bacterium]|nr:TIGR03619 family F420-dependent LLM class oxidoreductase [Microthrixaceae bacterium]MCB9402349.1 TIGR03619 family F420-dependent LLM class oxidoreductase [Microthrixaceae bacterium]HMU79533.1 TIGR03619 family F420-dependent LLM class oxidoreductase [Microthrixaceae bacterium]HMX08037.1 TIGR03619 family F420-dependent LLM class oxidoreductase [Microthrixaceae bacterium]HMX64205.1 TIGR03619 family F420-dependent LLM class oxidoreductase [Microthrixaceae bacterium]
MRFTYAEALTNPSYMAPLAQAADAAGYDAFLVPDSVAYPEVSNSIYPFTPDGSREFLEDKPLLEPFALISALAMVTERIRFTVSVLKLPVRHPLHTAKLASTAAVLSGNRLNLGVGVSPWPEDYEMTGTPWEGRGRRMDECIDIVSSLLDGGYHEHHGEFFDLPSLKICPVPTQKVPILVGGHSGPALRRAARLDGWIHGGGSDDLDELIERVKQLRRESDRADEPFQIQVISAEGFSVDGVRRLEDKGVTDVIVGFRWPYVVGADTEPLADKIGALERFAETTIAACR